MCSTISKKWLYPPDHLGLLQVCKHDLRFSVKYQSKPSLVTNQYIHVFAGLVDISVADPSMGALSYRKHRTADFERGSEDEGEEDEDDEDDDEREKSEKSENEENAEDPKNAEEQIEEVKVLLVKALAPSAPGSPVTEEPPVSLSLKIGE